MFMDRLFGGTDLVKAVMGESIAMMQLRRRHEMVGLRRAFRKTTHHPTNGKRECARRRRQIERGQLRAENGLVACKTFVVAE